MKYSSIYPKSRKETTNSEISPGTKLLTKAGYLEQVSRGLWVMTPLGLRVRRKVEKIVREEMEKAGAIEFEFPILHPAELWKKSGRWKKYLDANIAFTLVDRKSNQFILAPTAEELFTDFARKHMLSSYDLPQIFYQMSPKYRDEIRPRQGLIRGREFVMKDAYSFDKDEIGMKKSYQLMDLTYQKVFERCGFDYVRVEADSGAIGGSGSAEFMALTDFGEDTLLICPACGYGGNQEKAMAFFEENEEEFLPLERLATPDIKTVSELVDFVKIPPSKMVKTLVMMADEKPVIISIRGDLEVSEVKLSNLIQADSIQTASPDVVEKVTQAPVGFAGPIGLYQQTEIPYFFDRSVEPLHNFLCGGNQKDYHYLNVNSGRDFPEVHLYHDLSKAEAGHKCKTCQEGTFEQKQGIELGHIFQLQQVYSKPMDATFTLSDNSKNFFWMGCYGIGVSRMVQAIVEQSYDDSGIIWPIPLAPYSVMILTAQSDLVEDATSLYKEITNNGIDAILDERECRFGEKITDAELHGWPILVIVGKAWRQFQKLEVRWRNSQKFDSTIFEAQQNKLPFALMTKEDLIDFISTLNITNI